MWNRNGKYDSNFNMDFRSNAGRNRRKFHFTRSLARVGGFSISLTAGAHTVAETWGARPWVMLLLAMREDRRLPVGRERKVLSRFGIDLFPFLSEL